MKFTEKKSIKRIAFLIFIPLVVFGLGLTVLVFSMDTWVGFILFICVVSYLLFAYFLSRRMLQLLDDIATAMKKVSQGKFQHIPVSGPVELRNIIQMFNQYIDQYQDLEKTLQAKVMQETKELRKQLSSLKQEHSFMEKTKSAMVNVLEDIQEEKEKVDSYASDLRKFKLALSHASDHVIMTNPEGIIIYANQAVEKNTGYEIKQVIGKNITSDSLWSCSKQATSYYEIWQQVITQKKPYFGEKNNCTKQGKEYIVELQVTPILDNEEEIQFLVAVERDITRSKEVDRMKTEFISLASHQLRTPLSAIKWFLEILLSGDAGKLQPDQMEVVKNIDQSNQRMIDLVNSLLNISRIESGRIKITPKLASLKKVMNQVMKELEPAAQRKGILVSLKSRSIAPRMKIDPKLLYEVYKNLLSNAIKYTQKKGKIEITLSKQKDTITCKVKDNGLGIPHEEQARIFEKFFRGSNVTQNETEGTGLGLYLSRIIADTIGGKIWFESEQNNGSTFWFSFPVDGFKAKKGEVGLS